MPYSEGNAGRDSASSSSSITLMSDTHPPRKASSSNPHDSSSPSQDHQHLHLSPLVPVTTLDEGGITKTIGPPIPLAGTAEIPADEDIVEKARRDAKLASGSSRFDAERGEVREKDIFDRFTPRKKLAIVAIVSYCSFISPITSAIFLPSIPQMAVELHTTDSVIADTVAIFIVVMGLAPLIWSPLSGFYGRRPIYMASMPILMVASIGVALSPNVGALIGTRILQAIGGSSVLAVGAGSIGDIYRPTERGNAMGWYYSGALMGPTLAPVIGGIFSEYTAARWRAAQYFVAGAGALAFALVTFVLPETAHPPLPHDELKKATGKKFVVYRFNPFTSLGLFRWINVCLMSAMSAATLLSIYTVLVPLSSLFKDRYHINNLAIIGALYLPSGVGNLIGSRIAGPLADYYVKKYIQKRGYRRTEDRLRAAIPFGIIGMPISLLAYGWIVSTGAGGIAAPLVISVLPSMFLMGVLTPMNTYLIDSMPTRSAEVIAVNNFIRYLFSAAASAWVLPMSDKIGWGWTMTVSAAIVVVSSAGLLATLKWGETWRNRANERYHYTGTPPDCRRPDDPLSSAAQPGNTLRSNVESEKGSEHGENEEPGHLPASNIQAPRGKNERLGAAGGKLSRQGTREGQMPPVHEVLSRTVSLSGASAHGGG